MKRRILPLVAVCCMALSSLCVYAEEPIIQEGQTISYDKNHADLTDDEYMERCKEYWYDDLIFGSATKVADSYVKLDLFVEDIQHIKPYSMSLSFDDLVDEYDLIQEIYICGVKRDQDTWSYVGEPIGLFFSNSIYGEIDTTEIFAGDHLTVYGKVIHAVNDGWTGYNEVYVMPRIVENRGQ